MAKQSIKTSKKNPVKTVSKIAKQSKTQVKKTVSSKQAETNVAATAVSDKKEKVQLHSDVTIEKSGNTVTVSVLDAQGHKKGTVTLPGELFNVKPNEQLLAQAVRVYLSNQRVGHAKAKTRGEVEGSTRKIFKQKGTGNARHGSIRAPIFVGGGVAFGPVPRDYRLNLPKEMKLQALASAFSAKLATHEIFVVDGLESLGAKTAPVARALNSLVENKSILLLVNSEEKDLVRAARNIHFVTVLPARLSHAYAVMSHAQTFITKSAVKEIQNTFVS